jgi:hypothetical protein
MEVLISFNRKITGKCGEQRPITGGDFAGKFLGYHLNICRIIAAVFLIAMCGDWDTKIYLFFF